MRRFILVLVLGALPSAAVAQRSASPHGALALPCASCHDAAGWKPAKVAPSFVHARKTFPLDGAHARANCLSCHQRLDFSQAPKRCGACHEDRHSGELGADCARCHTSRSFVDRPAMQQAHNATRLPLRGAHAAVACESCHASAGGGVLRFTALPFTCAACHREAYARTTSPPHASSGFSTVCSTCHNSNAWLGSPFRHSVTRFPLTGAHLAVSCADCHGDGVYRGKPTACQGCHQADFDATTSPAHAANGIGTTCANCHTTAAWPGAKFDHSVTPFPLTGAHSAAACVACHADGVYRGKPKDCVSCHQGDYAATTNPNHATVQIPTTCASCHTTATWLGATFDHDARYFPIYSGAHRGKWSTCTTCHTSPSNYQVFTCLTCHLQKDMDDKHSSRAGYRYDSNTCYSCHPRGD